MDRSVTRLTCSVLAVCMYMCIFDDDNNKVGCNVEHQRRGKETIIYGKGERGGDGGVESV